jgi:hypothetical protein
MFFVKKQVVQFSHQNQYFRDISTMTALYRCITLLLCFVPQVIYAGLSGDYISIIDSDDDSVILELTVPEPECDEVWSDGILYHRIRIPGFAADTEVGSPRLLRRGTLIGIPDDATPVVKVIDTDSVILQGYNIYPSPKPVISEDNNNRRLNFHFSLNRDIYGINGFIPSDIARIDYTGYMRNQRVARVLLSAFQFNPVAGKLRYYSRIRVKVYFYGIRNKKRSETVRKRALKGHRSENKVSDYMRILKGVLLNSDHTSGRNK